MQIKEVYLVTKGHDLIGYFTTPMRARSVARTHSAFASVSNPTMVFRKRPMRGRPYGWFTASGVPVLLDVDLFQVSSEIIRDLDHSLGMEGV